MRKKTGSPSKYKKQQFRHSVEVTSAAWYLKENPEVRLEDISLHVDESADAQEKSTVSKDVENQTNASDEHLNKTEDYYPPALAGLKKIWNFVKATCLDLLMKDSGSGSMNTTESFKSSPVRLRKERKFTRCLSTVEAKISKSRKERPKQRQPVGEPLVIGK